MTNRHTTGRRGRSAARDAAARYSRLRNAGAPAILSGAEAWHLSGGIIGHPEWTERGANDVPLARVAKEVPDCEAFLDDWRQLWA